MDVNLTTVLLCSAN